MLLSENHYFLSSSRDVREICKPLNKLGIDYFSYTRSYHNGKRVYFNTSAGWLQHYFHRDYHLIGNCELRPQNYQQEQTFHWSTLPKQIIYDDARQMGIQDGLFIISPRKYYTEFFEFSTHDHNTNMVNVYLNNYELLQNFTGYFVDQAAPLIKEAESCHLILPHVKDKNQSTELTSAALNKHFPRTAIQLTHQQHQCATRLLQGKSQKVIARELGLSPRTVETYLINLKTKLGVTNRTELILSLACILRGELLIKKYLAT